MYKNNAMFTLFGEVFMTIISYKTYIKYYDGDDPGKTNGQPLNE